MLIFLPIIFLAALAVIFLTSVFTGRSIIDMGEKWLWTVWTVAGLWAVLALIAHLFKLDLYAVAGIKFGNATIIANVVFVGGILLLFRSFIHKMAVKASKDGNNIRIVMFVLGVYTTVESLAGMIGILWGFSTMVNSGELKTPNIEVEVTEIFSAMLDQARINGSNRVTTSSSSAEIVQPGSKRSDWKSYIMELAAKKGITASTRTYHGMKARESLSSIKDAKGNDGWAFCRNNYNKLNEKGLLHCATGYVFR